MKDFVKTKAFKVLVIVLSCIIGLTAAFVATVSTVFAVRKTAVVVIPGLLCSALQDSETGEIYYDPIESDTYGFSFDDFNGDGMYGLVLDVVMKTQIINDLYDVLDGVEGNFLDKFAINEQGEPVCPTTVIQWDHDGEAKYGPMTVMKKEYEYFAAHFAKKKNYDVFVFQYDWRRDNRIAAEQLIEATKDYDDVITVAHSMGNIVVSLALAKSETFRQKVILNCAYAAPYLGSYNALDILEDGESTVGGLLGMANDFVNGNSFLSSNKKLKKMLEKADVVCYEKVLPYFRGMPGIVQLLPCIELICPDGQNSSLTVNGQAITTKEQLLAYYQSCFWAHQGEDLDAPVRSWVADLGEYWDAFYVNGVHASKLVNTYYFAGYDVDTNRSATVVKGEDGLVTSFTTTKGQGDGTVPYYSATLGSDENVLRTAGYSHTMLGTAFAENMVVEQTEYALKSIDNAFKILANKAKYPL